MSEKLTKIAYNYVDDVLEKLLQTMQFLSQQKADPKVYNELETRYRVLQQNRNKPYAEVQELARAATTSLYKAKSQFSPEMAQNADYTGNMTHFYQYENDALPEKGFQSISKVPNEDPNQPDWVVLPGLRMNNKNPQITYITEQMGSSLSVRQIVDPKTKWPSYDTYIRGTQEAWNKFVGLAPYVFDAVNKLPSAKGLGLKSETSYNADYAEPSQQAAENALNVQVINTNGSQNDWDVGNKKNEKVYKPAIKLTFDPKDQNFFNISNILTKELGLVNTRTNPNARTIVVYDNDAAKLITFSQKMQQPPLKYPVKELNDAITALTGKSVGEVKKQISDKTKAAPLSEKVINNRIESNVILPPIDRVHFDQQIQQLYPGAFNPKFVGDKQASAQKDGMYFICGRGTSILADEPGAGKTAQSIVGADYATMLQDQQAAQQAAAAGQPPPPKKKILVFTPLPLVEEHWTSTGGKQSKPELFAGHAPNATAIIRSMDDFANVGDHTRWVVVPYTTMSMSGDRMKIATKIAQDAKAGSYGATILDELQTIKKLDSKQGDALRIAIGAGGIKHRVGLTGTPADNDPSDLYKQLRVTRHPILYNTEGVIQQTEKGFAEQFLGGAAYADKSNPAYSRIASIFNWAKQVDKNALIKLFATTYIRRTKEDMKPELPPKDRNNSQVITGQEGHWQERLDQLSHDPNEQVAQNPWQPLEKEMAVAKVPYTVNSAVSHLQNPANKLFIVTKYPDIAASIAEQINASLGAGTAAVVSGEVEKSAKQIVPDTFKQKGGMLKGAKLPLRAVVYTMKMGAVGLNFAVANKAIFNDIDWNPSNNLQAEDRVHRIDSPHSAAIEYIYFAGTYDQQMFSRVRQKEAINKEVNNVLRDASLNPEKANEVAGRFIMSLVDSLLFDIHVGPETTKYVEQKKSELKQFLGIGSDAIPMQLNEQPQEIAAGSWYRNFKKASLAHRHLW